MDMKNVKAINIHYDKPIYKILDYIHFNGAEAISFSEMLNYRITNYEIEFKVDDNISSYVSPIGVKWDGGGQYYPDNEPTNYVYVQMTPGNNGNYYTGRFMAGNTNVSGQNYSIVKTSGLLTTAPKFDFVWNELVSGNTYRYGYRNFATTTSVREGGLGRMQTRTAADFQGFYIGSCLVINYNGSTFTRSHTYDFKGNIYSFKYNDGVSVYNMVPAQRVSDNVCGLYDLDSGEFRAMVGTTITDGAAGNLVRYITTPVNPSVKKITDNSGNLIWGSQDAFPYRRLEYIHFNGAEYINDTYNVYSGMKLTLTFKADSATEMYSGTNYHGGAAGSAQYNNTLGVASDGSIGGWFLGAYRSYSSYRGTDKHAVTLDKYNGKVYIDGTQVYSGTAQYGGTSTGGLYYGCRNSASNEKGFYMYANIYRITITNNGGSAWVRNMVPCQRKSDGVCGLYNVPSGVFFPMQGTTITNAAAGPVVDEYWDMTDPF